jgi:ADP-heptose:LPS heptosyltransferase
MSNLVIMNKQLGDTLMLEPVLRKLAEASGTPSHLLCPEAFAPLIDLFPHTHWARGRERFFPSSVWAYDGSSRTTGASLLARGRAKTLLLSSTDPVRWSHRLVYHRIEVEAYAERYRARYFWDHTPGISGSVYSPPTLLSPPSDWALTGFEGSNPVVINPVSAWKRKSYPIGRWFEVLDQLQASGLRRMVLTGSSLDWHRDTCQKIAERYPGLVDLSGRTSLRQFIHLIFSARLVVTVDGAAAHLAAAFRRPHVVLFGPSLPNYWYEPREESRCLRASDYVAERRPSLDFIPARAVAEAVLGLGVAPD